MRKFEAQGLAVHLVIAERIRWVINRREGCRRMSGRNRRKPNGVHGFIADAINDRQRAQAQTQRLEAKAQLAWAKEDAKMATANAREKARQQQREAREQEIAEGHAEAEAVTRTLQGHLTELRTLLTGTLEEDPYLSWDRFKEPLLVAEFKPPQLLATGLPAPQVSEFVPEPPTGLGALAPGRRRAYAEAVAQGEAAYGQAIAAHAEAERRRREQLAQAQSEHEQSVSRERERVLRQHAVVDQMARDFTEGKRKAVADYFSGALTVQRYPSDFPTGMKIAYLPPDRELRIDIDLPLMRAVPELESAEYLITKKELKYKKLAPATRNKIYQQVVAQMALRTLRCVFAADRGGLILEAACNGYVDTIDTATGQDAHWCLVSVQVSRNDFQRLDLARVDPLDCLTYLHAKISKTPEKYQPVQPIIEYPWDDLHYAEELDAAAGLDSVQNLLDLDGYEFEQLLVKLCQAIPEFDEVRRTRSRADGGIDLVAVNKTPFVGGRVAIQAKRYAPHNKVDIAAVREIIGSISQREFTKGIIITTSGFTSGSRQEAERLGVELYDGERLLWLLRHHLHREFNIIDQSRRNPPLRKPPGPGTALS
jgi:restriction system protein